jgi:adenylate kinase
MDKKDMESLIPPFKGKFPCILIFGPPGVGKGTLSKFLTGSGGLFHLSSGDIFRGLSPESSAGQLFHSYAKKGHLLPDEATIAIWRHYVSGLMATNRYFPEQQYLLLDGVPRTANQVKMIDAYIDVHHVIVLEAEHQEELIKRLQRRAIIEGRHDDSDASVLHKRMEVYENETAQVLEYYPESLISRFNAEQRPLEVVRDVLNKLSNILAYQPTKS